MQGYFCARSYYNRLSNVDNVMITPQFRGGGSVSFLYCCGNEKAGTAHLEIFVSKDGGRSWSEEPIEALDVLDTAALTCTIDLSAYARKKIQLMFRHCKVKNENYLFIDDIRITLPKAETTTDVTLEFGAEHADMAAQFTGMDGYTVSGSTVTVPVIAKNVKEAREELGLLLLDKFAGPTGTVLTDNGERLHDPLDHAAALNPLSYYSSNYGIETEDSVAISSGKKFYVLWEKPLAGAVITLIPPEVGDTIEMDTGDQSDAEASDPGPTYVSSGLTVLSDSLVWYNSYDPDKDSFDYIFYGEIGYRLYYTEIYLKPGFGYCAEDLSNCVTVYGCHKYWWIADSSGWTRLVAAVCPHSDEPFVPSVVSHSLLLGGDIGVKFYMDLSGLDASEREGCYMVFTVQDEEYTVDFDPDNMNQTGIYYGFTCRVNALQMAEDITAVFHYTVDGEELEIEAAPYSVRTYIDSMLEKKEALSGSTIELITAIGNYGHYAQLFLAEANGFMIGENGEGDYAAMPLYDGTQFEDVYFYGYIDVSGYGIVRDIGESESGEEVVKSITFSLDLLSSTTVKVYFNPAPGHSISAAFNYEPGINTTEPDWEGGWTESGRPVLEIRNIPAHLLNRTYRFEAECNSDGDRVTCQIEVSALSYVNAVLNATEGPLATRNAKCAAAALYYYYMAMLGYTGSL